MGSSIQWNDGDPDPTASRSHRALGRASALAPSARRAAAWTLVWGLLAVVLPGVGMGLQVGAAAVVAGLLGTISPIRARWRPISGPVGLWMSRMLAPGDRAWHVRSDGPELVIVTARRGLRLTVAVPGRGAAEGLSVRRTRVLVLGADEPARR